MHYRHTKLLVWCMEREVHMATQQRNRQGLKEVELRPRDSRIETERRERVDYAEIARRAYERFEARGREHGRDQEDWFEAERERRNPLEAGSRQRDIS